MSREPVDGPPALPIEVELISLDDRVAVADTAGREGGARPRVPVPPGGPSQQTPAAEIEVRVRSEPTGQSTTRVTIPRVIPAEASPAEAGQILYRALFQGHALADLIGVRNHVTVRGRNERVALQLRFDRSALNQVLHPWELLHDGQQFLLLRDVDLSRHLNFEGAVVPVRVEGELRVLVVAAQPNDWPPLAVAKAARTLDKLDNLRHELLQPPTYDGLSKRLVPHREPVHVFDFEGHGDVVNGVGGLIFETAEGGGHFVPADALGVALAGSGVAVAVCNGCRGADLTNGVAATLVLNRVPAVIAMQGKISDDSANRFLEAFYDSLSNFLSLTEAVSVARRRLYLEDEWHRPVLYLRSVDAVGSVLARAETPTQEGPAAARTHLLSALEKGLGLSDFDKLCFDLGTSRPELAGETLPQKMISLIDRQEKHGGGDDLIEAAQKINPHIEELLKRQRS